MKGGRNGRKTNVNRNHPHVPVKNLSSGTRQSAGRFAATARKSCSTDEGLPDTTPERLVYQNFSLASRQRR